MGKLETLPFEYGATTAIQHPLTCRLFCSGVPVSSTRWFTRSWVSSWNSLDCGGGVGGGDDGVGRLSLDGVVECLFRSQKGSGGKAFQCVVQNVMELRRATGPPAWQRTCLFFRRWPSSTTSAPHSCGGSD
jgi:hypothetical protein